MQKLQFNKGLIDFIKMSPTPFHAVDSMGAVLDKYNFSLISEADAWSLKKGGRYYVIRDDSSIIAFIMGKKALPETGIRMAGAHTDSPCLRIKPQPEIIKHSFFQLGVEVYGGALLNPWFDRDLSIAGRVAYLDSYNTIQMALIDFKEPVAFIPSLAIHFDREANNNKSINPQEELLPVMAQVYDKPVSDFRTMLLTRLKNQYPDCGAAEVLDYEMNLYDIQDPCFSGMNREFISGARLDNLLSCYIAMMSLVQTRGDVTSLLVCNNHEEVGSASRSGAQGPFLQSVVERICPVLEDRARTIEKSMMISCDDAHGLHPNYPSKYDSRHAPVLNKGPVIKINANNRYASDSKTTALFRYLCNKAGIPVQDFVMRSDMSCGSTIGPITSTKLGLKTVDAGVPILGMHSIRELAGAKDSYYLYKVLCEYYQ
ncbi:Zinc metallopeptidase M18 domain-containing protein [Desulfonema limicola]|uniref:M18 family aminopeptidase n=1 Tax=Desulfonema limicola TaxID=45656 RepID=A0A975B7L5_9BACT|nr:M18 family aminopeptidase [Desulfonema limicola]QTA80192.1 Zinc metallopeptidase M18 domain-containing protein [Desulfonema limicola]